MSQETCLESEERLPSKVQFLEKQYFCYFPPAHTEAGFFYGILLERYRQRQMHRNKNSVPERL